MNWYGVLFGAAAAWQPGESSIPQFEQSFGQVFHGDTSGKINQAQLELMAAHSLLKDVAKVGDGNDSLFWVDPWSPEGQIIDAKIRPVLHDMRMHTEKALELIAEAQSTQTLRETGPLKAMDMGARRMDFIGLKFELADQMILDYKTAYTEQGQADKRSEVGHMLGVMVGTNGFCEDIRDGYSLTRDLYSQVWLSENRPYWLHNVTALYDKSTQLWLARIDKINAARRQWTTQHSLPPAESIGIPADLPVAPPMMASVARRR
jgi:hexosaminidase